MIRLIAADLDGTLLNDSAELSPRTIRAVTKAMEVGIKFVIASGRMYDSTYPFAERLSANAPIIVFNGAMACDWQTNEALFTRSIEPEIARKVCDIAKRRGIFIQYFPKRGFFYEKRIPEICDEYEGRIHYRGKETNVPLSEWIKRPAMKLLALGDGARLADLNGEICASFPTLSTMLSHPTYLEIVSAGVSKGAALKAIAGRLGISMEETAAFGDAENDLAMIKCAGYGYAMKNASEIVRAETPLYAPSNDEDGVAQVIETLLEF